jgi:hypothetical protein
MHSVTWRIRQVTEYMDYEKPVARGNGADLIFSGKETADA